MAAGSAGLRGRDLQEAGVLLCAPGYDSPANLFLISAQTQLGAPAGPALWNHGSCKHNTTLPNRNAFHTSSVTVRLGQSIPPSRAAAFPAPSSHCTGHRQPDSHLPLYCPSCLSTSCLSPGPGSRLLPPCKFPDSPTGKSLCLLVLTWPQNQELLVLLVSSSAPPAPFPI